MTCISTKRSASSESGTKHWRSSHYAVAHVRNKNSNIQGRSPNVVKVIFHTKRYGANSFLIRDVPFLIRDAIEENHYLFQ